MPSPRCSIAAITAMFQDRPIRFRSRSLPRFGTIWSKVCNLLMLLPPLRTLINQGGIIFFTGVFNTADPGFATSPDQWTQMTAFFHEQEHAANHDPLLDRAIDASRASYAADHRKINERCNLPRMEQESAHIPGELTLP